MTGIMNRTVSPHYYWHELNDANDAVEEDNSKIQKMQFSSTNVAACFIGKLYCLLFIHYPFLGEFCGSNFYIGIIYFIMERSLVYD